MLDQRTSHEQCHDRTNREDIRTEETTVLDYLLDRFQQRRINEAAKALSSSG